MKRATSAKVQRVRGMTLAEFAPALILFLMLAGGMVYTLIVVAQAGLIQLSLEQGASTAAHNIALAYGNDPTINKKALEPIFSNIRFSNVLVSQDQFEVTNWSLNKNPPTVTVSASYEGGTNGLPPFPNPDIFGINKKFSFKAQATARLE